MSELGFAVVIAAAALACGHRDERGAAGSASDPTSPIPGYRKVGEHRAADGETIVEVARNTPLPVDTSTGVEHGMALYEAGRNAEAEDALYPLCVGGDHNACGELAYEYSNPYVSFPHLQERGAEVTTKACEQHARPISCALLADAYRDGKFGLAKDPQKAHELVKTACNDGHYWSCDKLKSGSDVTRP